MKRFGAVARRRQRDALGPQRQRRPGAGLQSVAGKRGDHRAVGGADAAAAVADSSTTSPAIALFSPMNVRDERIGRRLVELVRRRDLLQRAVVEHADAVGHGQRLALVVRDVDDVDAEPRVQVLDLELHVLAQLLVERAERLVHQHELRLEHQRAGERDALLLAAGKLVRPARLEARHAHHVERAAHARRHLGLGEAAHLQRKGDILADRHVREERVVLEHDADVAAVRRHAVDALAVERDGAVRRRLEAGEHHQRRRLAGARRAEQRQELAAGDVEVEAAHHVALAVIGFAHAFEGDEALAHDLILHTPAGF